MPEHALVMDALFGARLDWDFLATLPAITTRQRGECRNCGQSIYRYAGRRTGIGAWWHTAPRKCREAMPDA